MSFFKRARGSKAGSDVNLFPEKGPLGSSLSAGARTKLEERGSRGAQEEAELRISLAQEQLKQCRELSTMRQAEHKLRMELLQLQLEALQAMAATAKGNNATTVVGYFQV